MLAATMYPLSDDEEPSDVRVQMMLFVFHRRILGSKEILRRTKRLSIPSCGVSSLSLVHNVVHACSKSVLRVNRSIKACRVPRSRKGEKPITKKKNVVVKKRIMPTAAGAAGSSACRDVVTDPSCCVHEALQPRTERQGQSESERRGRP